MTSSIHVCFLCSRAGNQHYSKQRVKVNSLKEWLNFKLFQGIREDGVRLIYCLRIVRRILLHTWEFNTFQLLIRKCKTHRRMQLSLLLTIKVLIPWNQTQITQSSMERNGDTNQAGIIFFGKAFQHIRVLLLRNILLHGCTLIRDSSDSPPPLFIFTWGDLRNHGLVVHVQNLF